MKVLVTGSAGFIGGYLVGELLTAGHEVVGLDNYSKYGEVERSYSRHPGYRFVQGDAKDVAALTALATDADHFVAAAAMIGGISYFHELAYDLLAENERIVAASFDAAIAAHRRGRLRKITVLSSSMVYENATVFPTPRDISAAARRRTAPTASRSSPASTSRREPTSSTACPTPSAARSTAWASASGERSPTRRCRAATSAWR